METNNNLDSLKKEIENDINSFDQQSISNKNTSKKNPHNSGGYQARQINEHYNSSENIDSGKTVLSNKHSKSNSSSNKNHRHKKSSFLRYISIILAIVLIIFATCYGLLHWELNRIQRANTDEVTDTEATNNVDSQDEFNLGTANATAIQDSSINNILLIGQDRRKGQKAEMRSDAMIIASINKTTKEIIQVSLMRDMYLPIPGYGYGPLNTTYMIGGFSLLNETIEKNFGIHIDGNLEVDFYRFISLMDILGPIEIDLSKEEAEYLNNNSSNNWSNMSGINEYGWTLTEGINTLSAEQLTLYCRMRKNIGGDWGRTDRQRKAIMACFSKLKKAGPKDFLSFIHEAMPLLVTDMTNKEIIKTAYSITTYSMARNKSYRIPLEGSYSQEIKDESLHVLVPAIKINADAIQKYIYGGSK